MKKMSHAIKLTVILLAAALWASSCTLLSNPESGKSSGLEAGKGAITITLGGASGRSTLSDAFIASGLTYRLTFSGPSGTYTLPLNEPTQTFQLEAGDWTITAAAYTKTDNTLVGTGAPITVTILAGQTINKTFTMTVDPTYEAAQSVFYIHNAAELQRLSYTAYLTDASNALPTDSGITFYLERDITVSELIPLGPPLVLAMDDLSIAANPFDATFDGQGHTITITSFREGLGDMTAHLGLFGYLLNGTVKNLNVVYAIPASTESNPLVFDITYNIGGLAGTINGATIENVHVSVSGANAAFNVVRTRETGGINVGGIAGKLVKGSITNSSFTGIIKGKAAGHTGSSNADVNVGGIVGTSTATVTGDAAIRSSFALGTVAAETAAQTTTENAYAGGILGSGKVKIEDVYAYAKVSVLGGKQAYAGGIAGYPGDVITNAYALGTVAAKATGNMTTGDDSAHAGGIFGKGVGIGFGIADHSVALQTSIKAENTDADNPSYVAAIGTGNRPGNFNFATPDIGFIPANTNPGTGNVSSYTTYMQSNGYTAYSDNPQYDNNTNLARADFQRAVNQLTYFDRKPVDSVAGLVSLNGGLSWDFTTPNGIWKWLEASGYHYPVLSWETVPRTDTEAAAGGFGVGFDWNN
ncbi:GLUG motif-containing protein [Leadbettera azotonutricia]|uniref:GLUG motif-containing protein n=1 Tax=Leadbettera azotonutricia TaxID=150829 RepID=UPI0011D2714B|nr:GLUG motif-containing protein [Leadbettera azotonutricia]